MCVQTELLLVVCICVASVLPTQVTNSGSDECYFVVDVPAQRMVSFDNINWPEKYSSGEICQWIFQCPSDSYCRLRCSDVGLPETVDCYMDKLLVYTKGEVFQSATRESLRRFVRHASREHSRHSSRKSTHLHLSRESARKISHQFAMKTPREFTMKPLRTTLSHYSTDDSNILMEQAQIFCGRASINVRSNGTKIAMVLISNELSPGGRFRCTVTPEKWEHRTYHDEDPEPRSRYYVTNKY